MRKAPTLLGRFPERTAASPRTTTYEVSLVKKIIRYQPWSGRISTVEHDWVYTSIVVAETADLAVYEALYEYFVWQISLRRSELGMRRLVGPELTLIDLFARNQAESALRRAGTRDQIIYFSANPWEPGLFTVHYESSR